MNYCTADQIKPEALLLLWGEKRQLLGKRSRWRRFKLWLILSISTLLKVTMKIIDESERLKGEMVGVSVEEEEGVRKRKGVINNLAEQETSR